MKQKSILTTSLILAGAVLVWLPVLLPLVFGVQRLISAGRFQLDYLMPAELLPLILAGAGLLTWAAVRLKSQRRWVLISLIVALVSLFGSVLLAQVSGLANGDTPPQGLVYGVVLAGIIIFNLAVISLGASAIALYRDLNHHAANPQADPAIPTRES